MRRILLMFSGTIAARWPTLDTLRAVLRVNHADGYETAWRYYEILDDAE